MISQRQFSILSYMSESKSLRFTAGKIGITPMAVLKNVRKMVRIGFLTRVVRSSGVIYSPTLAGSELLSQGVYQGYTPPEKTLTGGSEGYTPREKIPDQIRLHRLQIKFDLVNPIKDPSIISFKDHPSKIVPLTHWLKNIIEFEDFTAIISTKSLIISGIQRYIKITEELESVEASILSAVMPLAEQIEEKIRRHQHQFKLKRLDRGILSGKILSREYAYEHHPIAERVKKMEIKDPEDGKPRIIVDQSKGFPELETVHNLHATEDMDKIRKNTQFLAEYDLKELMYRTNDSIYEEAKNQRTSQDQMDQMISVMGQIIKIVGYKL